MLPADGAVEGAAEGPVISDKQSVAFRGEMCVVWAVARGRVEFMAVPVGVVSSKNNGMASCSSWTSRRESE